VAKKPKILEAKFEQTLIYADGPQVVLLSSVSGSKVIAVAIPSFPNYQYPFFAAQVSSAQFSDYLNEKFDLRYLLFKPDFKRNFFFDLGSLKEDIVSLERAPKLSPEKYEEYLPDSGLFARDHTEELGSNISGPQNEQTFGVDGSWDLYEFSHFYNNVTDLYAFFNSIDIFQNDNLPEEKRERIQNAFVKPFEGGGSYVSLYDSLSAVQAREDRLHVGGISYNSPGYVKLRGFEKPFTEIKSLIVNLESNHVTISNQYKDLYGILKKNKMLRMRSEKFNSESSIAEVISVHAKKMADVLDVVEYDALLVMSGNNMLVVAKVLLSLCRRAIRLNEFFLEGRVSFDVPTSQK